MRIAYLDCFAGISGDMFLAALIDAGVDPQVLHDAAAAMNVGASLKIERVDRSGISSTKVHVLEGGHIAETAPHTHQVSPVQEQLAPAPHSHHPQTQHLHKTGHAHTHPHEEHTHEHAHEHAHGRSLTVIRKLIRDSKLAGPVIHTAIRAFELLGASEAKIHNVPIDDIHFHEVGAVDAIIDIVAASAGIHALAADKWVASPLNVGGGMVDCAHGRFPVPAPATADLLRGLPTYSANLQMELVTPTGAALIRALVEEKGLTFGPQPAMRVERIGYGAGTRNPKDFPNVLRLSIGEAGAPHLDSEMWDRATKSHNGGLETHTVTVLETALDDLSPQLLAHVAETALQQGALDVMLTPVIMKKGRPGTLLTVLCNPDDRSRFEEFLLRETSTLGLRIREDHRVSLHRSFKTVETAYGPIRIKLGALDGETINANPEFEDCRAASTNHGVAVKTVHQAAIAAYIAATGDKGGNE
jgi:uncharacterized protein (TIGR00299 family) protein